jgi:hypothetical protein
VVSDVAAWRIVASERKRLFTVESNIIFQVQAFSFVCSVAQVLGYVKKVIHAVSYLY